MTMATTHPYYRDSLDTIRSGYEQGEPVFREILGAHYPEFETEEIWRKTIERFSLIYPDLPYIGGEREEITGVGRNKVRGPVLPDEERILPVSRD